jgi:beta-galactosidase
MMSMISIDANQLKLDGQSIPLLSGEVHYWRLQPYYWEPCLKRVREMGIDIIASYVCWEFHEYEPGKLDFTGQTVPERNLLGFLQLCQKLGFKIIIRPGPYIYSEWQQAGIPARLARYHRLHPLFLRESECYIHQVARILKPYFVTQGGPIILLQADNEIDSFSIFHGEQLGIYGGSGLFQEFLKEKYGDIEQLNQTWRTTLQDFSEALATIKVKDQHPISQVRSLDFFQFHHWCAKKIARWAVKTYQDAGVDIPIYLNTVHHCYSQNLREMAEEFGLVGIDLYPSNEFHANENEHLNFLRNACYASAVTELPYIPEFQSGIWHGYHYHTKNLTANHYRLSCLTALMGGIVGWNWYMLVERDNWYYSPINSRGFIRPELFEPTKKIAEVFHQINPAELKKMTATAITEDELHFWSDGLGFQNLVAKAVYESGLPFKSYDLIQGDPDCQLLFYAGPDWLPRERQERLRQFVESGGKLVCFNSFPRFDETFQPYAALPFISADGSTLTKNFDLKLGSMTIRVKDSLSIFRQVPGEPISAIQSEKQVDNIFAEENELLDNYEAGMKFIAGYQLPLGSGKLIFLGVTPKPAITSALHRMTGVPIYCQATTPRALVALFQKSEQQYYLIVINLGDEVREVRLQLAPEIFASSTWRCGDLFSNEGRELVFSEAPELTIVVGRKDGTVLELNRTGFH